MTDSIITSSSGEPVKTKFCSSCGTPASGGAFCASCGSALAPAPAPVAGVPAEPQAFAPGTAPAAGAYAAPDSAPWQRQVPPQGFAGPGFVEAGAVASQTTEYVQVSGLGAIKLASIGQRVGARLIDIVIVVIAYFVISGSVSAALAASAQASYSAYGSLGSDAATVGAGIGGFFLGMFLAAVFAYLYEVVMTAAWGRTLGKMVVGLRVIRAADGRKPNVGNAFLRWLSPGLGGLIPVIGPFGSLLVLLSPTFDSSGRRQGWHDKMAGTLVVIGPKATTQGR